MVLPLFITAMQLMHSPALRQSRQATDSVLLFGRSVTSVAFCSSRDKFIPFVGECSSLQIKRGVHIVAGLFRVFKLVWKSQVLNVIPSCLYKTLACSFH